ncbi:DUF362 domain-containing protein [Desulfobulbus alkaliphilus]|uniref:DUF362 domain-containing protein n=1 Tax=Desulfobulbus alkaliphilus TaxID=869814 RepID=UPI001965AC04|nr:DUF362 domain-containing protein [Desulfobulbus alkaliphilus]MBM9536959.1 DUF362 domain-containing protein [Desulfobulbus alkaliphilus]
MNQFRSCVQTNNTSLALLGRQTYAPAQLDQAVDTLLASSFSQSSLRTAQILLKPNLITATNGTLACTDQRMIVAVARWFLDQGARVGVGDSPAFGSARSVLMAIGALPSLQALGVPVVEFRHTREIILPGGMRAALATAALDCDALINLPKVKAHAQMGLTLAIKNYFGCLAGLRKPWWHMVHGGRQGRFSDLLVELLSVLPGGVSLVDGIVAMHRTGPVHGEAYPLALMVCGSSPVAVDTALLAVLGVEPARIPLWLAARRAGIDGTELADLTFPLLTPAQCRVKDFMIPEELSPVRFNPFRFVKNTLKRMLLRRTWR